VTPIPLISNHAAGALLENWARGNGLRWRWWCERGSETPSWVYVAEHPSGAIKIGNSHNPLRRVASLRIGGKPPAPRVLIANCSIWEERHVLDVVGQVAACIRGVEWFERNERVADLLARLAAAAESCFFDNRLAPYPQAKRRCSCCKSAGHFLNRCPSKASAA
jgi:hypothetical protein